MLENTSKQNITAQQSDQLPQPTIQTCENCHACVTGMYCSQCGQSVESTLKYFWTVLLHLLDDIFSFDSRASRTLTPLIFKPGFLTNEYIAGRRVHYVPPLRLYLFISIIFFLTLKFFAIHESESSLSVNPSAITQIDDHIKQLQQDKLTAKNEQIAIITKEITKFSNYKLDLADTKNLMMVGMTKELVELEFKKLQKKEKFKVKHQNKLDEITNKINKLKKGEEIDSIRNGFVLSNNEDGSLTFDFLSDENNKKLTEFSAALTKKAEKAFTQDSTPLIQEAIEKLPQLMFILLPLFAALLKVMFIFSKRLYLEHLTVALHSHSFIFLIILLMELLDFGQSGIKSSYPLIADGFELIATILFIWMPIYLFLMQKRVYKQGVFFTLVKFSFIGIIYTLMISLTGTIAFIWSLAST